MTPIVPPTFAQRIDALISKLTPLMEGEQSNDVIAAVMVIAIHFFDELAQRGTPIPPQVRALRNAMAEQVALLARADEMPQAQLKAPFN